MKITTLIEDTVSERQEAGVSLCHQERKDSCGIPQKIQAQHGLSFYIETGRHTLLMDTGASDLTWENARVLGADLSRVDTVVISHGHYDHAGGLLGFARRNTKAEIYLKKSASGDFFHGERYIGIDKKILELPNLHLIEEDEYRIDEELSLFSNITERKLWPESNRVLTARIDGKDVQDDFSHEQCLVISENGKKVLLSGCAHNGILNILNRFREIWQSWPDAVVSGFHMMKKTACTDDEIRSISETARELAKLPSEFYTGHCTGKTAFDIMKNIMGEQLRPICSGSVITL